MIPSESSKVVELIDKLEDLCEVTLQGTTCDHFIDLFIDCKVDFEKLVARFPMRYAREQSVIDFNCSDEKYFKLDTIDKDLNIPIFIKRYDRLENVQYLRVKRGETLERALSKLSQIVTRDELKKKIQIDLG